MKTDRIVQVISPDNGKLEKIAIHSFIVTIRMGDKSLAQFMRLAVKYRISIQDTRMESIFDNPNIKLGYRYAQFLFFIPEIYIEPFKAEGKYKLHEPGNFTVPDIRQYDDHWMCLVDGTQFFPFDPNPKTIKFDHIAHCLSNLCRYSGHTKRFYSVAEHAYWVSYAVPESDALEALLHDASETYCADLPSPIKRTLPEYRKVEDRIQAVIAQRFNLKYPFPDSVHVADKRILANEYRDILNPCVVNWVEHIEPLPNVTIQGWLPDEAKSRFIHRYFELYYKFRG